MFDAAFIANPYLTYERLRATGPIHWVDGFRWGGSWLIPHHEAVLAGLRDQRLSSQRSRTWTADLPAEVQGEFEAFNRTYPHWMLFLDRPRHTRLRALLNKSFTRRMVDSLRPLIQQTVDGLLAGVIESGRMEFIGDFAHPMPVAVIADLMGVPPEDQRTFKKWSYDFAAFFGSGRATLEQARSGKDGFMAITDYFRSKVSERQRKPGNDLISLLLHAEVGGDRLTTEEVLAQCSLLLAGGHETTRNLLGSALLNLLRNPEQLELLKREPSLLPGAVQEVARYESPVQLLSRVASEDVEMHGQTVRKGQTIILLVGSANRDPAQFTNPDTLDITRDAGDSLAFGQGPHFCLGQMLASAEVELALWAVLTRLRDLRLAERELVWTANPTLRGLTALQVEFSA
ncbi:MAG: cytochrome P450 [Ramlibacter sp.]|nr:cytochrome P450 [Ramlibacter sp.]